MNNFGVLSQRKLKFWLMFILLAGFGACKKGSPVLPDPGPVNTTFSYNSVKVNGNFSGFDYFGINLRPTISVSFSAPLDKNSFVASVTMKDKNLNSVSLTYTSLNNDSLLQVQPSTSLNPVAQYSMNISTGLKSKGGAYLISAVNVNLMTAIDSANKFPVITNDSLLTLIQKRTFGYFWDFGHPVSGMARERNTSGDIVTSGGTGFGLMAIPVAIERKFISRTEGAARVQKIVSFLKNNAITFHGAYPHWINGSSGVVVPFSDKDNGADLVETSYLMMGLLTDRQYFNGSSPAESKLVDDINVLWNKVEWNWFRRNDSNLLYWHWSPNYDWAMNMPIRGWNECLITYVLAASSTTYSVPKMVYDNGFANNGTMKNGGTFYGIELPLGPSYGGPLFFEHYSFLGINPSGLTDAYADYGKQTVNHTKINFEYCKLNPKGYYGYSKDCWGLTASDIQDGYTASSPTNDVGVIAPTAAISSLPYTPAESLNAIRFFYYQLGDRIWGTYGFTDAFNLHTAWFASSYLAIDQGPQIVMIENYRSGLIWRLFMSCPEIKSGMRSLGFGSSNL